MKLLAIILMGSLALAEASALLKKDKFNKLDAYLVKTLPNNDNVTENLEHLSSNMDQLTGSKKVAAQIVLDLNGTLASCDDHLLSNMLEILKTKLLVTGKKRIERLLEVGRTKAADVCSSDINQSVNKASPNTTKFFSKFMPQIHLIRNKPYYSSTANQLVYFNLRDLAKEFADFKFETKVYDEQKGKEVKLRDRAKFDQAYEEFYVRPCKSIVSKEENFETILALTAAKINYKKCQPKENISLDFDGLLRDMNWAKETCEKLLRMDTHQKDRLYKSGTDATAWLLAYYERPLFNTC